MSKKPTSNGHNASKGTSTAGSYDPASFPSLKPTGAHEGIAPIPLHRPITMVGSRKTARLHLNSPRVSKAHALIVVTPTKAYICDLLSREGTRIKGHAVKELELRDGDEVEIAQFKFIYQDPRPKDKEPPPEVEPLALQIEAPTGKQRLVLEKRVTLIGRRYGSDAHLPMRDVSTTNTAVVRLDGFAGQSDSLGFVGWAVFDLGGKGTIVNGRPVHKARISAGDVLTIGSARVQVVSVPQDAREQVSLADRPAAAARTAALAPAQSAFDLDEIKLDEELTPEGLEEDLLGGSHVMEAITEPEEAAHSAVESGRSAAAEDFFEGEGGETAAFDTDSLRADEPLTEGETQREDSAEDDEDLPARGWRSTTEDEAPVIESQDEQTAAAFEQGARQSEYGDTAYEGTTPDPGESAPLRIDSTVALGEAHASGNEDAAAAHYEAASGQDETVPVPEGLAAAPSFDADWSGTPATAQDDSERAIPGAEGDFAEREAAVAEWDEHTSGESGEIGEYGAGAQGIESAEELGSAEEPGVIEVPELDLSTLDFETEAVAPITHEQREQEAPDSVMQASAALPQDSDLEAMAEAAEVAEGSHIEAEFLEEEDGALAEAREQDWSTDSVTVGAVPTVAAEDGAAALIHEADEQQGSNGDLDTAFDLEGTAGDTPLLEEFTALTPGDQLDESPSVLAEGEFAPDADFDEPLLHGASDPDIEPGLTGEYEAEVPAELPPKPLFAEFAPPQDEEEDFADIAESVAEQRNWIRGQASEQTDPDSFDASPHAWEAPAAELETVLEDTESTPESALDLAALADEAGREQSLLSGEDELALDDADFERAEDEGPSLSDSALLMELEALSEESRPETERGNVDEERFAVADRGFEVGLDEDGVQSDQVAEDELGALEPFGTPSDADEVSPHSAAAIAGAPQTSQENGIRGPEIEGREHTTGETGEETDAGSKAPTEPQPPGHGRPARSFWQVQQDSFLGNAVPMVGSDFSVPKSPAGFVPHISGARKDQPKAPKAQHAIEQVPEGLADDKAAGAARASAARRGDGALESATEDLAAVAGNDDDFDFVLDEEDDSAPAPTPPESTSSGAASKPPRPQKVSFGGAVVADLHEAIAPGAANPFSSNPVGSQGQVLDPSAVMPEASGLVDLADASSRRDFPSDPQPVMEPASQSLAVADHQDQAEAAERDPDIQSVSQFSSDRASDAVDAQSARGRIIEEPIADDSIAAGDETADRVDDFVRTIRAGVRGESTSTLHERNGNGQVTHMDAPRRPSDPAESPWSRAPETLHAPPVVHSDMPLSEPMIGEPIAPKRRMLWMIPLLIGLAFVASIGAVAGIWYGMQPSAPVQLKMRYDVPEPIDRAIYLQYRDGQLARLLDDSLRLAAVENLQRNSPEVSPGFLGSVEQYNQFALGAFWTPDEPDTIVMSRRVPIGDGPAESARLKAVAAALYDRGGTERAARARYAGEIAQLESELVRLDRELAEIDQSIQEAVASLPAPDSAEQAQQEAQLEGRISRLDEQWSSAGRRVTQLRQQMQVMQQADPLAEDDVLADLRRQLAELEARMAASPMRPGDARADLEDALPAAGLFKERLDGPEQGEGNESMQAQRDQTPEAEQAGQSLEANALPDRTGAAGPPADARKLRQEIDSRLSALERRAATLASDAEEGAPVQVIRRTDEFTSAARRLLDEALPAQLRVAGEVELLRQSLARVRRERSVALLDQDERVGALRAEVALRERELNAAISDGLVERTAALRLAHRMSRDRLSARVEEVTQQLESDAKVSAARTAYEQTSRAARGELSAQRAEVESALALARRALEQSGDAELARAASQIETTVLALARERVSRLPWLSEIWSRHTDEVEADEGAGSSDASADDAEKTAYLVSAEGHKSSQDEAEQLRRQIAARESELRKAHEQKLSDLSEQLVAAEAAAAKAQREAQEARTQLAELRAGREGAERQRQRVAQLRIQRVDQQSAIDQKSLELKVAEAAAGVLPTPRPPADVDIQMSLPPDQRPRAIVMALLGIAAVTLIGLFFTLRTASRA